MNIESVLKAIEEAKLYTNNFFGRAATDAEVLAVLSKILEEKKEQELRKRFAQYGPEYLVAVIAHLKERLKK